MGGGGGSEFFEILSLTIKNYPVVGSPVIKDPNGQYCPRISKNGKMRSLENAQNLRPESATNGKIGERKTLFHELLLNTEMDKQVVIDTMAITIEDRNGKTLSDEEFQTLRKSCAKSVSNFISRSFRPSTAKATYNGDPAFNTEFILNRNGDNLIIEPVEAAAE